MGLFRPSGQRGARSEQKRVEKAQRVARTTCARGLENLRLHGAYTYVITGEPITFAFHRLSPSWSGVTYLTSQVLVSQLIRDGSPIRKAIVVPLQSILLATVLPSAPSDHVIGLVHCDARSGHTSGKWAPAFPHVLRAFNDVGLSQLLFLELATRLQPETLQEVLVRPEPDSFRSSLDGTWAAELVDAACRLNPDLAEDIEFGALWRRKNTAEPPALTQREQRRYEALVWKRQQQRRQHETGH